jgi:hypothetical protein
LRHRAKTTKEEECEMKRLLILSVAALGSLLGAMAGEAGAQYFNPPFRQTPGLFPGARPGLSPYLDLLRGGNPAINYYLGTLPELDRRANAIQFGSAITDLERRTAINSALIEEEAGIAPTGHPVYFLNYGSFYNLGPTRGAAVLAPTSGVGAPGRTRGTTP